MGQLVNGVATLGKLVNGVAPFNMSTELASGVAPLANGENGGRRGTDQTPIAFKFLSGHTYNLKGAKTI
jgi:hypothetical protein